MTARRIVLDANILIRAVMGKRVPALIDGYADRVEFFAPETAFAEAVQYLPALAERKLADPAVWLASLDCLRLVVTPLADVVLAPQQDAALARIGKRDPKDWPAVAAALVLGCPIWTEDKDFFGTGVPTWTSDLVEIYLRGDRQAG